MGVYSLQRLKRAPLKVKQVIVVRTRYPDGNGGYRSLRTGKIAAQVAHASLKVILDRCTTDEMGRSVLPQTQADVAWVAGSYAKIVLGVDSEESLEQIFQRASELGIPAVRIVDEGRTEFQGVRTYTAVALGPAEATLIDTITGPQGSVSCRLI